MSLNKQFYTAVQCKAVRFLLFPFVPYAKPKQEEVTSTGSTGWKL